MRRKSLGKGIHALIRTNIPDPEEKEDSEPDIEDKQEEEGKDTEPVAASTVPEPIVSPEQQASLDNIIPEDLINQLREIKEMDFEEKRTATYQKALERAWFDEKITADEQFILDGLREVLEISDEEHRTIELSILQELEARYSDGIDKDVPLGNIENEHDRQKREIYDYFQRGSEMYEADKFFEAITQWEKILEIDPANPLIMKAINNARRRLDSPSIEAIGQETVYTYRNPLKDIQESEELAEQDEKVAEEVAEEEEEVVEVVPKPVPEREEVKPPVPLPITDEPAGEPAAFGGETEAESMKTDPSDSFLGPESSSKSNGRSFSAREPEPPAEPEAPSGGPEKIKIDNTEWISKQKEIQTELMAIKKEDNKESKKIQKIFKIGLKNYKAGKYVKAMKLWKKVLSLDPEHTKAKKGMKLALKKYKLRKKSQEKKKLEKARMEAKISEMEIPELAEAEAAAVSKREKEMEIPKIELQPEAVSADEAIPEVTDGIVDAEATMEPETGDLQDTGLKPEAITEEPEPVLVETSEVIEPEIATEPEEAPVELPPEPVETMEELFKFEAEDEPEDVQPIIEEIIPPERSQKEILDEHYERALNFARIGKFREAIDQLNDVISAEPNNSQAWNDKGFLLWSTGRLDESLECYEKAVSIDPAFTDAWVNKGVALNKMNQREKAIEAYDRALSVDPNLEEAWTNKGVVLFHMRKMNDAVESFKKGLEINPRSEEAWLNLGYTYEKIDRFSDAVKAFEEVLKLNPSNSDAHAGIAACQQNLKYELLREWNI